MKVCLELEWPEIEAIIDALMSVDMLRGRQVTEPRMSALLEVKQAERRLMRRGEGDR